MVKIGDTPKMEETDILAYRSTTTCFNGTLPRAFYQTFIHGIESCHVRFVSVP